VRGRVRSSIIPVLLAIALVSLNPFCCCTEAKAASGDDHAHHAAGVHGADGHACQDEQRSGDDACPGKSDCAQFQGRDTASVKIIPPARQGFEVVAVLVAVDLPLLPKPRPKAVGPDHDPPAFRARTPVTLQNRLRL